MRFLNSIVVLFLWWGILLGEEDILAKILTSEATVTSFDPTLRIGIVRGVSSLSLEGDAHVRGGEVRETGTLQGPCSVTPAGEKKVSACGRAYTAPVFFVPKLGFMSVGGKLFRGTVEVFSEGGTITAVNILPIEEYVRGVINKEIMANWPPEAKKAQAILARTYAVYKKVMKPRNALYDLEPTVLDQVYGGLEKEDLSANNAVAETHGVVLVHNDFPAEVYFHSTCGGRTASAKEVWGKDVPYLSSVPCNYCASSPLYRWTRVFDATEVEKHLTIAGYAVGRLKKVEVERGNTRVAALIINSVRIEVNLFRKALGFNRVYSNDFEISLKGGKLTITGRGFGHGVGVCQYGMAEMARQGRDWRAILRYYLPGIEIRKMY